MSNELTLTVSEFVAVFNQTMDIAYPNVAITGELANFRVSKNRWVYFDLKDDESSVKFFATVYQLPGPLEDGMLIKVMGQPRLHNLYGFSVSVLNMQPVGEGSIKKAAELLKAKLTSEGLFDESRKRILPYPPQRIGLITSKQSAAYADFIKILKSRWSGLEIGLIDVQVQGEVAPIQITSALEQFNADPKPPEVVVIIRGGGSAEDLAAFSSEEVTRAVATSRVPTLVAIGHEIDVCLAELAADTRASTPSNAAELLVPDKAHVIAELSSIRKYLAHTTGHIIETSQTLLKHQLAEINDAVDHKLSTAKLGLINQANLMTAFNPSAVLKRGYALVRDSNGQVLRSSRYLQPNDPITVQLSEGGFKGSILERF